MLSSAGRPHSPEELSKADLLGRGSPDRNVGEGLGLTTARSLESGMNEASESRVRWGPDETVPSPPIGETRVRPSVSAPAVVDGTGPNSELFDPHDDTSDEEEGREEEDEDEDEEDEAEESGDSAGEDREDDFGAEDEYSDDDFGEGEGAGQGPTQRQGFMRGWWHKDDAERASD